MRKYRIVCLSVVAWIGLASGQSSKPLSSSAKLDSDPLKAATKPLTPKSAMPSHRKTAVAATKSTKRGSNATAELAHLERQNSKAAGSKTGSTAPGKSTPGKSVPSRSGSKINFKYQKPPDAPTAAPSP